MRCNLRSEIWLILQTRDRYEQECLKIKGYLAQGHMVMGQEERKNKAKLEKTQINLATSNTEYEAAVKVLEETTGRWNREWKAAADKFQDLEEERLDFMKSSLWSFANIASTVCVSDDASCEKVRLSLENCEVEKDIISFIKEQGTGQEIPDAPKYINFCRGDVTDTQSMTSNEDEDAYSVAQFQRTINPSYRSSSPQPSTFESHHDPNSVLARELGHREASGATMTPQSALADRTRNIHQEAARLQFEQSKQGPSSAVAHDPYPMDGMTMLCRPGPPSDMSSARSAGERPSSRDSHSEYSNPTSFSSMEGPSGKSSPVKQHQQDMVLSPVSEKSVAKKKSGFFNSPFKRKKSIRDLNNNMNHSSTPTASSSWNSPQTTPGRQGYGGNMLTDARSASPEPVDPRASFQLNVGNNVFDVATPGQRSKTSPNSPANPLNDLDPIAQALADLKGVTKQSSVRMSADMYHGIATPAPGQQGNRTGPPLRDGALMAGMRGTPPPSYDQPVSRLGAPQPAFTSKAMQASTQKYVSQTRDVFASPSQQRPQSRGNGNMAQPGRPQSRGGDMPRATSPLPMRGASPRPFNNDNRGPPNNAHRSPSPNPYSSASRQPQHSRPQSYANTPTRGSGPNMNQNGSRYGSPAGDMRRSASPAPYANMQHDRSNSEMGMQLAQPREGDYGSQSRGRGGHMRSMTGGAPAGRPQSSYGGQGMAVAPAGRERSKSVAAPTQFTKDGRPVLHFGRLPTLPKTHES